jgi:HSP90 family molecular chaperone
MKAIEGGIGLSLVGQFYVVFSSFLNSERVFVISKHNDDN